MTLYGVIFYGLAGVILAATLLAATRRDPVHAVLWLVVSFLGTAMLFYLLGAPLPAALEVIVYAGAIMVLFLFIVMLVRDRRETGEERSGGRRRRRSALRWIFPVEAGLFALWACFRLAMIGIRDEELQVASATPAVLGRFLFDRYWLPVEIVSLLLFVALVGTLFLGKFGADTLAEPNDEVAAETADGTGRKPGTAGRSSGAATGSGTDWRNEP